jgi:hypothetical protein
LNKDSYDFIVRTNLSSVWNFKVLLEHLKTLPKERVYNGFTGSCKYFHFASGSGYILTPDIARFLIENRNIAESYPELDDLAVAFTLNKLGINPSLGKRNDTLIYNNQSYHYRFKDLNGNRSVEKNNMLNILNLINQS